jgi:uncharacterized protein YjiS (DUF1127 family)
MQSTYMNKTPHRSVAAIYLVAAGMQVGARRVRAAAKWLHNWLEKRRIAAAAFRDFSTMGDRELHDIGLSRFDVPRVAWGASDRYHYPI